MVATARQKKRFHSIALEEHDVAMGGVPVAGTGVTVEKGARSVQRMRLRVDGLVVNVDADDDFGSHLLATLPNADLMILGCIVSLTAVAGGGFSTLANLDVAVGTVATASTDFSNANEDDLVAKIDGTAGGVVAGGGTIPSSNVVHLAAAADNEVYLNLATGAIATDGTVTLTGFVDVLYIDQSST